MNAILQLLEKDHQEALGLISDLEAADEILGTDSTDSEKFDCLNAALKLHTKIEEEFVYPLMADVDETRDLIQEFYKEHEKMDELLAQLSAMTPKQSEFRELLPQLQDMLESHISKEEDELFPRIDETIDREELNILEMRMQELKNGSKLKASAAKQR